MLKDISELTDMVIGLNSSTGDGCFWCASHVFSYLSEERYNPDPIGWQKRLQGFWYNRKPFIGGK